MAGLLGNGWDDPQSSANMALAAGLLRGDFGAGLLGANQAYQSAQDSADRKKYMGMQMQNMQSEIAARQAQLAKQQQLQDMVGRLFGGGQSVAAPAQPGQLGSGSFGVVAPPAGQPPMPSAPAQRSGLANASIDQIAGLHALGGPDLLNAYKMAREGFERKPGTFYENIDGGREYVADPTKGITYQNGKVGLLPGYADTQTALTLATEAPKTLLNSAATVNLRENADGTKSPVSALSENPTLQGVLGQVFPGRMGAPAVAPASAPMAPQRAGNPALVAGAQDLQSTIAGLQSTLADAKPGSALYNRTLNDIQNAQAELAKIGGGTQSGQTRYGMTTEQTNAAAKAKAQAEAEGTGAGNRTVGNVKKGDAARDMLDNLSRARTLLTNMDPTASTIGALADKGLGIAGISTPSTQAANALETISGWLTSNTPRMEGPQSDKDVANYRIMAAQVGDRTKPVADRLAALNEVERIQKKYAATDVGGAKALPSTLSAATLVRGERYSLPGGKVGEWDGMGFKVR